jgi:crotonobetainyl-CoA:carnitine CoA-transferase CaiB-like acyl-CoA transferase
MEMNRPFVLDGVRVVDTSTGLSGPVVTRWLAEMGADVIKVEPPDGDPIRRCAPAAHANWNRSKRSVVLDLDEPAGRRSLSELLAGADVFVHNWTTARATSLGLSTADLGRRHTRLIVASVTGYPIGHPDEERPADELLVQARVGAMDEQEALRPGPMFTRLPFASWGAAYLLCGGIGARLVERELHGVTRSVHTSLMQGSLAPASLYWQRAERPPEWMANHTLPKLDNPANLTIFECADGRWLQIVGGFTKSEPIDAVLDDLDARDLYGSWVTPENRERWAFVMRTRTLEEWTDVLWPVGVVCMPVLDVGEILATEQAVASGYAVEVDDPLFGRTVQASFPFVVDPPPRVRSAAPELPDPGDLASVLPSWSAAEAPAARSLASPRPNRPLAGLRVLDFGSYVAGPYGAQCLADFGADVIKVEPPAGERGRVINQFTGCQRGKRSLALDLGHPSSRDVLARLIRSADVVMHNVRLGAAARMGIDEASVRALNPRVVFIHSSAYGPRGPWSEFAAFDPTAFALSGWTQQISGPGKRPTWLRSSVMDCFTGLSAFNAVVFGLFWRAHTGEAMSGSTSLLATAVTFTSETVLAGPNREPVGIAPVDEEQTGMSPYHRIYEANDGWIAVAALSVAARQELCDALSIATIDEAKAEIGRRRVDDLAAVLDAHGVPVERVALDNRDALFDRELAADTGLVRRMDTLPYGWFETPGGYWSDADGGVVRTDRPIPAIGEHSAEVLHELGFSDADIDDLVARGVVAVVVPAALAGGGAVA